MVNDVAARAAVHSRLSVWVAFPGALHDALARVTDTYFALVASFTSPRRARSWRGARSPCAIEACRCAAGRRGCPPDPSGIRRHPRYTSLQSLPDS